MGGFQLVITFDSFSGWEFRLGRVFLSKKNELAAFEMCLASCSMLAILADHKH